VASAQRRSPVTLVAQIVSRKSTAWMAKMISSIGELMVQSRVICLAHYSGDRSCAWRAYASAGKARRAMSATWASS
jgi:hypothetical protein